MRSILYAALLLTAFTGMAAANPDVAGQWHTNLGHGVTIDMSMTPDGNWSSQTRQQRQLIRELKGTYKQEPSGDQQGTLVFTPTEEAGQGAAQTESDEYQLAQNGKQLRLTSQGDTMVFTKRR